ncbi:hypothetical protein [Paraburkholderia caribensis]|nr:hypothetical protein [Paraburkholderia caribensis]
MQKDSSFTSTYEAHTNLAAVQSNALLEYGARLIVIRELCHAMLAHMSVSSRANMERTFRERIERVMELTDDKAFPPAAQTAFLGEINYFLGALNSEATT